VNGPDRYAARGVSAGKEEVHAAIAAVDKGLFPKAFCKVVPDALTGSAEHALVMHADGAGTKSSLAYAYWKETGDLSVWKGIAQDAIVMNLDDLLCVGVTGPILFSSTIGRNKRLVPGEVIKALIEGTEEVLAELRAWGVDVQSTGGETADLGDLVRTVVVDSTVVARIRRDEVIDNARIEAGDVVLGLESGGQAAWESEFNGGMGSNGLTAARHEVFKKAYLQAYPETCDPGLPQELLYAGSMGLTDAVDGVPLDAGRLVLSPTRTYAPLLMPVVREFRDRIHGLVHCSGGGQTKVLHFLSDLHVIKDGLFPTPPLFSLIQREGGMDWREMYRVFNMGHRMEVYTDEVTAAAIADRAEAVGIAARIVGRVEPSPVGPRVTVAGPHGTFEYGA
jgi:phosphoribosylformylglycinamidine cyclo-ligase